MLHLLLAAALPVASLVLNEIMVRPPTGGSEWIELYGPGADSIPLAGVTIEDARGRPARLPAGLPPLPPGGFLLLAAGPDKVLAHWGGLDSARVVKPEGTWPTLNDSDGSGEFADIVVLRDASGARLDSMAYSARWLGASGVSLERVDPGGPSLLASNWSPSIDAEGATPLARNSLTPTPAQRDQGALIVPFGPCRPGDPGAQAAIGWRLDRPARLALRVFDLAGRPVRLLKPMEESGTVGRVIWDGRDDAGRDAPPGVYLVLLEGRLDEEIGLRRWRRPLVLVRSAP